MEANAEIRIVLTDIQMPAQWMACGSHIILDRYSLVFVMIESGAIRPTATDLPADAPFFQRR